MQKTNVMRILEQEGITYNSLLYDAKDGKIDGVSVAQKIGCDLSQVFKTLVCQGKSGKYLVFVIPVAKELDLKAAAKVSGEKKVDLIAVKNINKVTGYIRGGCSPIGMKKHYPTYIDSSAENLKEIVVSAGQIGEQIVVSPHDISNLIDGSYAELCK